MVCMGDGVEDRFVMEHGKENGWWELWSWMKHDELKDMGHFGSHEKRAY
jgi:hypothetical protein